jgi:hypothetical protein
MSLLSVILNVLWIVTGGIWMAVAWLIGAVLMAITIIGLPWTRAAFNIANYALMPFGRVAVPREVVTGREDLGTGPLGTVGNIIWVILVGWLVAGARPPRHRHRPCRHDHRHPVRLGAPQDDPPRSLAGGPDNRDHGGSGTSARHQRALTRLGKLARRAQTNLESDTGELMKQPF